MTSRTSPPPVIKPSIEWRIPAVLGLGFTIDFGDCDNKDIDTIEYLKKILPGHNYNPSVNSKGDWLVPGRLLEMRLYAPKPEVLAFVENKKVPHGIEKWQLTNN